MKYLAVAKNLRIAVVGETTPETWTITLESDQAPAVCGRIQRGFDVKVHELLRHHAERDKRLPGMALMIVRGDERHLMPRDDFVLQCGDKILFCASEGTSRHMTWTLSNRNVLRYVQTGRYSPDGTVWRWWWRRYRRKQRLEAAK